MKKLTIGLSITFVIWCIFSFIYFRYPVFGVFLNFSIVLGFPLTVLSTVGIIIMLIVSTISVITDWNYCIFNCKKFYLNYFERNSKNENEMGKTSTTYTH